MNADDIRSAAMQSKAWPYEEARKLLKRWPDGKADGGPIVFETGYGPSGLPHIGTFNEVLRTTFVRRAFEELSGQSTRLIAFSDDMDGLRKVPDNVPMQEMLRQNLGRPLTKIPDPFGTHQSFADHNNAMLRHFLDRFGFDYEFLSATECYSSGRFDEIIRQVLRNWDEVMGVMLPTLREERRRTYSPVLPVSPTSGIVLQVPVEVIDAEAGLIAFADEGQRVEQSALGGKAKLQWKVDWAARWVALGIDYEMAGKDLIESVVQSGKIARILGGRPPEGFNYEMFLDEKGEKISKSKGNGLSLEEWLRYGSEESLAFYIYREPRKAKSLHIGVIPRAVDDYWQFRANYSNQPIEQKLGNPVHHIHGGQVPKQTLPVTYGLLLNLVSLPGVGDKETVWKFVRQYSPDCSPENHPELDKLIELAVNYGCDFVAPNLKRRPPSEEETAALRDLDSELAKLPADADAEAIQHLVFEIGKTRYGKDNLRSWFQALYETLLGSSQGPRMGSFIALYGIDNSRRLIEEAVESAQPAAASQLGSTPLYGRYKPLRNYLRSYARIPALEAIYELIRFLQFEPDSPPKFLPRTLAEQRKWDRGLFEWELEVLAREVLINSPDEGKSLGVWKDFANALNHVKRVENDASGLRPKDKSVLVELARIPHRQFHWQRGFDKGDFARAFRLFSHTSVEPLMQDEFGMTAVEFYQIALALAGHFLGDIHLRTPITNELNSVSEDLIDRFIDRFAVDEAALHAELVSRESFDANWAYTFNPLWLHPLIRLKESHLIAPIPTLLLYRTTSGVFFDLVGRPEFSNAFGRSFQDYVGDVIEAANVHESLKYHPEHRYGPKKQRKDSADWIVEDSTAALFIECKCSRMKFQAKSDIVNREAFESEITKLASFVVQLYATVADALNGRYDAWKPSDLPVFPIVVTLEDWHVFGEPVEQRLHEEIETRLAEKGLSADLIDCHPYQIWSIDDFEKVIQVLAQDGILPFLKEKTGMEKRRWPVHNPLLEFVRAREIKLRPLFPSEIDKLEPQ